MATREPITGRSSLMQRLVGDPRHRDPWVARHWRDEQALAEDLDPRRCSLAELTDSQHVTFHDLAARLAIHQPELGEGNRLIDGALPGTLLTADANWYGAKRGAVEIRLAALIAYMTRPSKSKVMDWNLNELIAVATECPLSKIKFRGHTVLGFRADDMRKTSENLNWELDGPHWGGIDPPEGWGFATANHLHAGGRITTGYRVAKVHEDEFWATARYDQYRQMREYLNEDAQHSLLRYQPPICMESALRYGAYSQMGGFGRHTVLELEQRTDWTPEELRALAMTGSVMGGPLWDRGVFTFELDAMLEVLPLQWRQVARVFCLTGERRHKKWYRAEDAYKAYRHFPCSDWQCPDQYPLERTISLQSRRQPTANDKPFMKNLPWEDRQVQMELAA